MDPVAEPAAAPESPTPAGDVDDLVDIEIKQTARPRARGSAGAGSKADQHGHTDDVDPQPVVDEPAPAIPRDPVDPATLTPPGQAKAKAAGRRGGLSRYQERTGR